MSGVTRILWYNWKDIKHPEAGGAEVFTHEVAKRLALRGYSVTLFTSSFPGAHNEDVIDGVRILRNGSRNSVHGLGRKFYEEHPSGFDIVVDEINTKPFMTPLFVKKPKIALIHQLAREYWLSEVPFPANLLGYYYLENHWLRRYANVPTVTVSASTRRDLESLGFSSIFMVPEGLTYQVLSETPLKNGVPTVMYLGRLTKAKRVEHLLKAFARVRRSRSDARLWVVGDGYLHERLKKRLGDGVLLFGKLPKSDVSELLREAWVLVYPSVREGFGLAIIEANAHGTPAIGYDVAGVRDAIQNGDTGILVQNGEIAQLANAISSVLEDESLRLRLSRNALAYSRNFSWDKSADEFEKVLNLIHG
ncbi:MAG: glycosyltransferase family 4 protein [Nitrososphaerota archaeon]|nr:glycosyltransferase family 4 protein [Nitrososphaerota archaeon]MDG7024394.1 glycosyltransferase family 4 protein [Nitrososphaerota archaeon]